MATELNNKLKIFTLTGSSGAGKTDLYERLTKELDLNLQRVITCTTRPARKGKEVNGVHYHFLSEEEFKKGLAREEFAEHAKVYQRFYGSKKIDIEKPWKEGFHALLSVDLQGALSIKQIYGKDNVCTFISPAHIDELRERLIKRGDSALDIERRVIESESEMLLADKFDYRVINGNGKFEEALQKMREIILYESRKL